MDCSTATLLDDGYEIVNEVVSEQTGVELAEAIPAIETSGSRKMLAIPAVGNAVTEVVSHEQLAGYLADLVAVQCTLFLKSQNHNWSVQLHRDLVVPVQGNGLWTSAGIKEGLQYAKPPREFLAQCVAIRVHLDGAPEGDLLVVPGSHIDDQDHPKTSAIPISVPRYGGLLMKPLLAHASSKLLNASSRRVLHYLFAPLELPENFRWYHEIC